jgi:hypothetical protein
VAKADVAELVDARDLKSLDGNVVWVRVPPPAPMIGRTSHLFRRIRPHRTCHDRTANLVPSEVLVEAKGPPAEIQKGLQDSRRETADGSLVLLQEVTPARRSERVDTTTKVRPMNEARASPAYLELTDFFNKHSRATLLMRVAGADYAASRCLLLNGLFAGLVLGSQAIEKSLKAYLLFHDPQRHVRRLSHSLPKLLTEARSSFPNLSLLGFEPVVIKFGRHYETRYPDNPGASSNMTTADLLELDELIIFLSEHMPCPRNVRYRAGIYPMITFSLGYQATVPPTEFWIKNNNRALAPLLPRIHAEHMRVMEELYPETP